MVSIQNVFKNAYRNNAMNGGGISDFINEARSIANVGIDSIYALIALVGANIYKPGCEENTECIDKFFMTFEDNLDDIIKGIKLNTILNDTEIYCLLVTKRNEIDRLVDNAKPHLDRFDRASKKIYDKLGKKIKEYQSKIVIPSDFSQITFVDQLLNDSRGYPTNEASIVFERFANSNPSIGVKVLDFQGQNMASFLIKSHYDATPDSLQYVINNIKTVENLANAKDLVELNVTVDSYKNREQLVKNKDASIKGKTIAEQNLCWSVDKRCQSNCLSGLLSSIIGMAGKNDNNKYDKQLFELQNSFIGMLSKVNIYAKKLIDENTKFGVGSDGKMGSWIAETSEIRAINFTLNDVVRGIEGQNQMTTVPDYINFLLSGDTISTQQRAILEDFKKTFNIGKDAEDTELKLYTSEELKTKQLDFIRKNNLNENEIINAPDSEKAYQFKPSIDFRQLKLTTTPITDSMYDKRENNRMEHNIQLALQPDNAKSRPTVDIKNICKALDKLSANCGINTERLEEIIKYTLGDLNNPNPNIAKSNMLNPKFSIKDRKKFVEKYKDNKFMTDLMIKTYNNTYQLDELGLLNERTFPELLDGVFKNMKTSKEQKMKQFGDLMIMALKGSGTKKGSMLDKLSVGDVRKVVDILVANSEITMYSFDAVKKSTKFVSNMGFIYGVGNNDGKTGTDDLYARARKHIAIQNGTLEESIPTPVSNTNNNHATNVAIVSSRNNNQQNTDNTQIQHNK